MIRLAPVRGVSRAPMNVQIRLTHTLDAAPHVGSVKRRWIFCPWLNRFPHDTGIWVGVLAAHDANGTLLDALHASGTSRPDVYAAVFAVDPFRSAEEIIRRITLSGVGGVINCPSISFIDGAAGATFDKLSLGVDRELEFLAGCAAAGLRVAGLVRTVAAAERLLEIGVDFLVAHGGPPTSADRDPSIDAVRRIGNSERLRDIPIVPLSFITRPERSSPAEQGGPKGPPYREAEHNAKRTQAQRRCRDIERRDVQ